MHEQRNMPHTKSGITCATRFILFLANCFISRVSISRDYDMHPVFSERVKVGTG
jgi:hypothetical protein